MQAKIVDTSSAGPPAHFPGSEGLPDEVNAEGHGILLYEAALAARLLRDRHQSNAIIALNGRNSICSKMRPTRNATGEP